jgi:hypothetical protein
MEEGPPTGNGQAYLSNNLLLLQTKAVVVSDGGKANTKWACVFYEDEQKQTVVEVSIA